MMQEKFTVARWFVDNLGQYPRRLLLISAGILVSGFVWHLLAYKNNPDTLAFPRSGAVLVMFAITAVFFNHILGIIKSNKEQLIQKYDKPEDIMAKAFESGIPKEVADQVNQQIVDNTFANDPTFFRKLATKLAREMKGIVEDAKGDVKMLNAAQANIAYTEAGAGVVGTFIWAFGDLVFEILFLLFRLLH